MFQNSGSGGRSEEKRLGKGGGKTCQQILSSKERTGYNILKKKKKEKKKVRREGQGEE